MRSAAAYFVHIKVQRGVGAIRLHGRRVIHEHGRFGPCHMLPAHKALELVDRGLVKLRPGMSLARLRAEVEAMATSRGALA